MDGLGLGNERQRLSPVVRSARWHTRSPGPQSAEETAGAKRKAEALKRVSSFPLTGEDIYSPPKKLLDV